MDKLSGQVALVTGAGRMRGIGRAAALALAREGANVVVTGTGRDPATYPPDEQSAGWRDVDSVAQEIAGMGREALALVANITKGDQVQAMVDQTVERFGRVDILVNNASAPRLAAWAQLEDLSEDAWRSVLDIKVTGAFLCTQAVVKEFLKQGGGGSVVNVISVEAKIARAADVAYAVASGALYTFTGKAGRALAPHGIRVNAVSPGTTDTARNGRALRLSPEPGVARPPANDSIGAGRYPGGNRQRNCVAMQQRRRVYRGTMYRNGWRPSHLSHQSWRTLSR